jgi:hypothetical protein
MKLLVTGGAGFVDSVLGVLTQLGRKSVNEYTVPGLML